jgi:hypothetical protein
MVPALLMFAADTRATPGMARCSAGLSTKRQARVLVMTQPRMPLSKAHSASLSEFRIGAVAPLPPRHRTAPLLAHKFPPLPI